MDLRALRRSKVPGTLLQALNEYLARGVGGNLEVANGKWQPEWCCRGSSQAPWTEHPGHPTTLHEVHPITSPISCVRLPNILLPPYYHHLITLLFVEGAILQRRLSIDNFTSRVPGPYTPFLCDRHHRWRCRFVKAIPTHWSSVCSVTDSQPRST